MILCKHPKKKTYYFENLPDNNIEVTNCCDESTLAAVIFGATYLPNTVPIMPDPSPITVNRIIQRYDSSTHSPVGSHILSASLGEIVVTTIQVTIPEHSRSIKIIDPFPGALIPLDSSYKSLPDQESPFWPWVGSFYKREFLKGKILFYGQNISPGTYTLSYTSVVSTPGKFLLPPTMAYDVYQPEIMGLSEGGIFTSGNYQPDSNYGGGTCLPWNDRTVSPEDLAAYLTDFSPAVESPFDLDYYKWDMNLGLKLGLGIGIPAVLFAIGGFIYFLVVGRETNDIL